MTREEARHVAVNLTVWVGGIVGSWTLTALALNYALETLT